MNNLVAGNYSVTVSDNNGCSTTASASITQPLTALSASTATSNVSCNGGNNGTITLTANGGTAPYSYNWGGGITTQNRNGLSAGTYTATITDNNGCSTTASASITQPLTALSATTASSNVSCNGGNNGTITLTANGGTAPYTYNWGGGITTQNRNGLGAGTYTATITDNNGCRTTASATITQPLTALSATTASSNVSCNGGNNGTITLTANGGTAPYTYNWGGGITTQNRNGLSAGTYTATITDNNGCSTTASATITQPLTALSATTATINVSCNGGNNGTITLTANGGTAPYTYNWTGGATTQNLNNLVAGNYSVTVSDNNGCSTTASASITQPLTALSASTASSNVSCNGGNNGTITLTANGGTAPYSYNWGWSA